MAHSSKRIPIHTCCRCRSQKVDKQRASRKMRREEKAILRDGGDVFPLQREVSNVYLWNGDGKFYDNTLDYKLMRK